MVDAANLLVGLLVQKLDALVTGDKKLGLLYKLDEGEDAGAHWYFCPHNSQPFSSHFAVLLTALRCALPLLPTSAADRDSTMTRLSGAGRSLRPDGQLRSGTGLQLLFKWEVKATSGSMLDAVEDLQGESGNPKCRRQLCRQPWEGHSKPARMSQLCHVADMLLKL